MNYLLNYWNIQVDKILITDGYTNIYQVAKDIVDYNNKGIKVLILFDADASDSTDNNNGFKNKIKYLENKKLDLKIQFETYLFPDNENDGDLELFIKDISKHKELYTCWDQLWDCVKNKQTSEIKFSKEGSKSMLYYYVARLFGTSKTEQKKFHDYYKQIDFSDDKWEIEKSEYATKLKNFLINI